VPYIDAYEVPPEADAEFLAAGPAGVVHRALRPDVRLRWVTIGDHPSDLPFPHRGGDFRVVHEDGDVDGAGGVILINAFEVSPADDERFLAGWHAARDLLTGERGYLGTRLHFGDGDFRFVDVARWSSPLMIFRANATAPTPFPSHPGIYERVVA
jgi:hypothetical protein